MKTIITTIVSIFLCTYSFAGDILTLNNQMVFDGKVKKVNACSILFQADGKKFSIPGEDIHSIQFAKRDDKVYTSYLSLLEQTPNACMQGRLDAENLHGKSGMHIGLGVLFGPFAIIGAAVGNPSPNNGRDTYAMSQNDHLFQDSSYLNCYKRKARSKNVKNTALGWAAWILLLVAAGG